MNTVAAISFRDNHSLSMDIEDVNAIELGTPMQIEDGKWFCELIIRGSNGTVAVQLVADAPEKLSVGSFVQ